MAFDQVAQPSATAYPPSSSSTQPKMRYDVFVNHRGPDVKHTLAKAIYDKLSNMGVKVFLDDQALERGDSIPTQIEEAMNDALLHVAIFSARYAESPWCLAELSYMLRTGVTIIPIFYHVNPSALHWVDKEGGIYAGSFARYETKRRYTAEKLGEWKEALQTVSSRNGFELKNDDWGWVLEGLANSVMAKSKPQVARPTTALGLEERVGQIEEIIQGDESAQIVGIVGMGGSGKTTLAKELFCRKSSSFFRRSFLYNVRDAASKDQLSDLQKRLLEDLGVKDPKFRSIGERQGLLENHLRSLRALIVLDDVDCAEQIDSLLPEKDSLGSGSLVIITTRNAEALTSLRMSERSIYRMKELSSCHARELFCSYAFQTSDAPDGFEDLVKRALKSCRGLPLSLKVFGGQLCFKPREYWESQINEISRVLPKGILSSLKISYDALDPGEQECFLDVACYFVGERKSLALQLWDGLGRTRGVYSWVTLQNKCLVEVDEKNQIRMHDHLRDLGREIANKKSPYRLWCKEQFNIIRTQAKVRGIMAATASFFSILPRLSYWKCTSHYPPPFEECVEVMGSSNPKDVFSLKYLVFNHEHFNPKIGELSRGLVWLRCFNFNHANLSSCLSLESLRVLELYDVKRLERIWENDANAPLQLTELIIHSTESGLECFQGFLPSIKLLGCLKKIVIDGNGSSMSSLPNEFCNLNSLEYLELCYFKELSSLPDSFGNLRSLRHLELNGCFRINTLPDSFKQLTKLQYLNLFRCTELTFNSENSSILQNMTKLEDVNISACKLKILPLPNQASLTNLQFYDSQVRSLPDNIGQLENLKYLAMGSRHLTSLPNFFGNLRSLEELFIYSCHSLSSLPATFGDLSSLRKFVIRSCPKLKSLPATFGCLNALEELQIQDTGVESLPESFGLLASLCKLWIRWCPIRELPFGWIRWCPIRELPFGFCSKTSLNKLREIRLVDTLLSTISISEDCCPSLETLILWRNTSLRGIETLPKTLKLLLLNVCLTPAEEQLRYKNSRRLELLEYLRSLETLEAHSDSELPAIQSLEHMQRLKTPKLSAYNFAALEPCIRTKVNNSLRSLETLEVHSMSDGPTIQSLEQMQRLKTLKLSANNFAALEPSIRTIKKWPSEIQVWARAKAKAMDGMESILNDFPFVVKSFTEEADAWTLAPPHMQSSDAAIVCFVIEWDPRTHPTVSKLYIQGRKGLRVVSEAGLARLGGPYAWLEGTYADGAWVWISVCDFSTIANEYHIRKGDGLMVKRGTSVVGEKERVKEAFKELLALLKGEPRASPSKIYHYNHHRSLSSPW